MLYHVEDYQRQQRPDVDEAFNRWLYDNRGRELVPSLGKNLLGSYQDSPRLFTVFLRSMRDRYRKACPESIVESEFMTFGGADGGGGVAYVGVEAEHLGRALDASARDAVVAPFEHDAYMDLLKQRIMRELPQQVLIDTEVGDHGTVLHVQGEFLRDVREVIIPPRPYLQANVETVTALSKREYDDLLDRIKANPHRNLVINVHAKRVLVVA